MRRSAILLAVVVVALFAAPAFATNAAMPVLYKNCTAFNAKYPHGVGKAGARDKTKSGDPVMTFKRSTALYVKAMSFNKRLDRDKDGIACEQH